MLKSGAALAWLSGGVRAVHDGLQPLQPLEPAGALAADVRSPDRVQRHLRRGGDRRPLTSRPTGPPAAQKGGLRPRHRPLARRPDHQGPCPGRRPGPPRVLLLSAGNVNDISIAAPCAYWLNW